MIYQDEQLSAWTQELKYEITARSLCSLEDAEAAEKHSQFALAVLSALGVLCGHIVWLYLCVLRVLCGATSLARII